MSLAQPPRSARNNNPGNLRTGIAWKGLRAADAMTPAQRGETEFCVFASAKLGFRALATDLLTSWREGHRTVREIITRFAPPSENDTGAYVDDVAWQCAHHPDQFIDLSDPDMLRAMCRAIAVHEAGGWFYALSDLTDGVAMATGHMLDVV